MTIHPATIPEARGPLAPGRPRRRWHFATSLVLTTIGLVPIPRAMASAETPARSSANVQVNTPVLGLGEPGPNGESDVAAPAASAPDHPADSERGGAPQVFGSRSQVISTAQNIALFALVSLAPAALLMLTAFVRINIVLVLLRQAQLLCISGRSKESNNG